MEDKEIDSLPYKILLSEIRKWYRDDISDVEQLIYDAIEFLLQKDDLSEKSLIQAILKKAQEDIKSSKRAFCILITYFLLFKKDLLMSVPNLETEKEIKNESDEFTDKENFSNVIDLSILASGSFINTIKTVWRIRHNSTYFSDKQHNTFLLKLENMSSEQIDYIYKKLKEGYSESELLSVMKEDLSVSKMEQIIKILELRKRKEINA